MEHRLAVGDIAPDFSLPDVEGGAVALDPASSSATVVVFTANGCPYALAWHDRIQDVARDYEARGVRVLQIVSNDESGAPLDTVERMRERVELRDLSLTDPLTGLYNHRVFYQRGDQLREIRRFNCFVSKIP